MIFQDAKIDGKKIYNETSYKQQLNFKLNREIKQKQIDNLRFLICYGIKGHAYIYCLLKLIYLQKEVFVLDLELGN